MKAFVTRFFLFSLPIFLLIIPLDHFLSTNLCKSNTYVDGEFTTWTDIYNGDINADIVIYGASRALGHIIPEVIEDSLNRSCYNLGINGLGLWHIYLRHLEYIKYNVPPKYIILSVDVFSLDKGKNLYNEDQFLPYMLGNRNMYKYLRDVNEFSIFDYILPLIRFHGRRFAIREAIKCSLNKQDPTHLRHRGYLEPLSGWSEDFAKAKASHSYLEVENDLTSISLLDKFLSECIRSNISVIFVNTPDYIEGQRFIKNRQEVIEIYKTLSKKYEIPFLDYSDHEICFQRKYFYNTEHLNNYGSTVFNMQYLVKDLKMTNGSHGIYLPSVNK